MTECFRDGCKNGSGSNKYCSTSCSNIDRAALDVSGTKNPNYNSGKEKYTCEFCGSSILRYSSTVKNPNKVFCNSKCQGKWKSENKSGPNSPLWNGGSDTMSFLRNITCQKSWTKISKEMRANSSCSMCNEQDNLVVHHIIPLMYGGVSDRENLMVLCRKCHKKAEKFTQNKLTNTHELY